MTVHPLLRPQWLTARLPTRGSTPGRFTTKGRRNIAGSRPLESGRELPVKLSEHFLGQPLECDGGTRPEGRVFVSRGALRAYVRPISPYDPSDLEPAEGGWVQTPCGNTDVLLSLPNRYRFRLHIVGPPNPKGKGALSRQPKLPFFRLY
jgi:hypothetical protein